MKLLIVLLAIVATVTPAPQGLDTQDAEFLPTGISKGSPNRDTSFPPDGFDIHVVRIPQFSLLDLLFGNNQADRPPQTRRNDTRDGSIFNRLFGGSFFPFGDTDDTNRFPLFPSFTPFSPSFSDFPDFTFPNITSLGDLPDGYKNSTHDIKVVNGSRVEVNQTISKTNDNGIVITKVIINLAPENDGPAVPNASQVPPQITTKDTNTVQSSTIPNDDPRNNQVQTEPYEDFGNGTQKRLSRHRRWVLDGFNKPLVRRDVIDNSPPINSLESFPVNDHSIEDFGFVAPSRVKPLTDTVPKPPVTSDNIVSLEGDTNVNFIGPKPRDNPDAEVFDVDLLKILQPASRFQPLGSNLIRSQPIRTQPIWNQPIRAEHVGFQPLRAGPVGFQPIRAHPARFQPIRTDPIALHPFRFG